MRKKRLDLVTALIMVFGLGVVATSYAQGLF
jgi:hypothetical protein